MTSDPFDPTSAPIGDPVTIIKGNYLAWQKALDYSTALFEVSYLFRLGVAAPLTVVGVQAFSYWTFNIPSAVSATWPEGAYTFDIVVKRRSDNETIVVASGATSVFAATSDRRTHAQVMLAKIESILENRADNDVASYTISGRSISKMTIEELRRWRDYYLSEVAANKPVGQAKTNKVKVRFV